MPSGSTHSRTESVHTLLNIVDLETYTGMDGNMFSDVNGQYDPKPEFHVYDIVWGKVRGYPWWPGRICDPSASSNEAKMLFRKGSYLIDYFGDHSFTWNEAPHIKPFLDYFSQMEKQSNKDEFQNAIACALDEFLRRVELGVVCYWISGEVYPKLKNQIIISDGVRQEEEEEEEEEDSGNAGDGSLTAVSFEPQKLIMLLKEFAQFSYGKADQLELSTSVIQLSAFYCWKSSQLSLPTENDAYISVLGEKTRCNVLGHNSLPVTTDEKLVQKSKSKGNYNHISEDNSLGKEQKSLSDLTAQKCFSWGREAQWHKDMPLHPLTLTTVLFWLLIP